MQNPKVNKTRLLPRDFPSESLRLFYAFLPDEQTNAELQKWQTHVSGKKTPAENLHLTLFFLGRQPQKNLPALKRFIDRISFEAFEMKLDKIGYFPKIGLSWIGPSETSPSLSRLFEETHRFLIPAFLKDKSGNFWPHITLARRSSKPEIKIETPWIWKVNRLALMQSVLSDEPGRHPDYRILHERKGCRLA